MNLGNPARGLAYITHIETHDTYANSPIIITPKTRDKLVSQQFTVLKVGDWGRCEDEECERTHANDEVTNLHPHHVEAGDWVLVRNRSWSETTDPNVYVVGVDHILAKFVETP